MPGGGRRASGAREPGRPPGGDALGRRRVSPPRPGELEAETVQDFSPVRCGQRAPLVGGMTHRAAHSCLYIKTLLGIDLPTFNVAEGLLLFFCLVYLFNIYMCVYISVSIYHPNKMLNLKIAKIITKITIKRILVFLT